MRKLTGRISTFFINKVRSCIRYIAFLSDIKLNYPYTALGQHSLVFKDIKSVYTQNIPPSVIFNTRSGKIEVGRNCVFGEDVMLLTGKHKYISEISSPEQLHEVPTEGRDIIIGDNCYIGSGAILIGPLKIGDYSVIGAGSVVTKNIPERTMYGGVPAKKIKDL